MGSEWWISGEWPPNPFIVEDRKCQVDGRNDANDPERKSNPLHSKLNIWRPKRLYLRLMKASVRLTTCGSWNSELTKRYARLFIAFSVAPLVPVLLYYCVLPKAFVFLVGAAMSYCAEIVVGIPLYFRARHLNRLTQNACISGGFISGAAYSIVLTVHFLIENWSRMLTEQFWYVVIQLMLGTGLVFGICGAIAGWVFAILAGITKIVGQNQ